MTEPQERVAWLNDLVRLEITLWERVDAALKQAHDLPLSSFEALFMISDGTLRVGDLAAGLRITVGGASKLADRVEKAGLISRAADPGDRRASRLELTPHGTDLLAAATLTYSSALAAIVDPVLTAAEQRQLHDLVGRLLR